MSSFFTSPKFVWFVNYPVIIGGGTLLGALSWDAELYYRSAVDVWLFSHLLVYGTELLFHALGKAFGKKIQTSEKAAKVRWAEEIFDQEILLYVASLMFAWPVTKYRLGLSQHYVWDIDESFLGRSIVLNVAFVVFFFLAIDVYTYFKHRSLHLKYLFAFHEQHHLNFNPNAFASYSTSPFEALLTFVPALWDLNPFASYFKIYAPLQMVYALTMVVQNVYLHCGYTFDFVEKWLPRVFLNTSGYHNFHHSHLRIHFAEVLTLWDFLLGSGATYYNKKEFSEAKFVEKQRKYYVDGIESKKE